jgi:ABC-type transporter Mla subunit MlaD
LLVQSKQLLVGSLPYEARIGQARLGGLRQGTEVFYLGTPVGEVSNIDYITNSQNLKIKLLIKRTYQDKIFSDTRLELRTRLPVGGVYLELTRGAESRNPMPASEAMPGDFGDVLVSDTTVEDQLAQFRARLDAIVRQFQLTQEAISRSMDSFDSLSKSTEQKVSPTFNEIRRTAESMRDSTIRTEVSATRTLADLSQAARSLESEIKGSSLVLNQNVEQVQKSFAAVQERTEQSLRQFDSSIKGLETDIRVAVAEARKVLVTMQSAMRDFKAATRDLPATVDNVNNAVNDADDVIEGVKRHPLLRNHVDQETGTRQTLPSGVRGGGP